MNRPKLTVWQQIIEENSGDIMSAILIITVCITFIMIASQAIACERYVKTMECVKENK